MDVYNFVESWNGENALYFQRKEQYSNKRNDDDDVSMLRVAQAAIKLSFYNLM